MNRHACFGFSVVGLIFGIYVLPLSSQIIIGTLSRPNMQPYAVSVYETGNKVFIADNATGNLYTYDGDTHAEINSVFVGTQVSSIIVHETSAKLYAFSSAEKKIAVLDVESGAFIHYVSGTFTSGFTSTLDENLGKVYAFVAHDTIAQIDIATDSVTPIALSTALVVAGRPPVMTVNPVTHEVFVTRTRENAATSFLEIIDGNSLQKSQAYGIGGGALGIGVNWLENKVYVTTGGGVGVPYRVLHRNSNTVSLIPADNDAVRFAFDPTTNRIYSDSEVNAISTIIDGPSDTFFNLPMVQATIELAFRYATGHVYFVNQNFIGVLDQETQLLEMIPVDNPDPSFFITSGIAINQATGRVYVINDSKLNFVTVIQDTDELIRPPIYLGGGSEGIHIVDPINKLIADTWILGGGSDAIAIRPGGGRIYAPAGFSLYVYAGSGSSSRLEQIDVGTPLAVPVLTPDGKRVYATAYVANKVIAIDLETRSIFTEIPVSSTPWGAVMTPDGSKLYVGSRGFDNNVSVIDVYSNTVSKKIPLSMPTAFSPTWPWGLTITPSGSKVYVAHYLKDAVSVISTKTDTVIKNIPVGEQPRWLAATPDGRYVYVTNAGSNTVSIIDSGTDTEINTVAVGPDPRGIGALPDGSAVFVVNHNNFAESSISIINTSDFSVTTTPLPSDGVLSFAVADPTSKFAGRVTKGEAPVDQAVVRALQDGIEIRTSTSNLAGDYSIYNLRPGTYDIELRIENITVQVLQNQSVARGQTAVLHFNLEPTCVEIIGDIPQEFYLNQNYPNPFNPSTTIRYELPYRTLVRLSVFDFLGREIAILTNEEKDAGRYDVTWRPSQITSGIYFCRLQTGDLVQTRKLILIR